MAGILKFWSSGGSREGCVDLFLSLAPHLLLLFSIKRFEKWRIARLKPLTDLPQNVVENILMRLPTKSLSCIKCTSKSISTIIDSPGYVTLVMSRMLNSSGMNPVPESPQLMLFYRSKSNPDQVHLQSLKYDGRCYLEKVRVSTILSETSVLYDFGFVFYNLVLLFGEGHCFLINPLGGEVLEIPTRETTRPRNFRPDDFYGMGFDDTANTYKIVWITADADHQLVSYIYVLGQSSCSWREIQAVPPDRLQKENLCAHGDVHWFVDDIPWYDVGAKSRIISFDFKKEDFCWTPHPTLSIGGNQYIYNYGHLLHLKGSMALVDTSPSNHVLIWVMKNYEKKEWALDYRINVEEPSELFKYKSCGEWSNGIFFVNKDEGLFHYNPNVCYFLDFKRNSVTRITNAWRGLEKKVFSCTGSLISLKMFGSLVHETKANVWHIL